MSSSDTTLDMRTGLYTSQGFSAPTIITASLHMSIVEQVSVATMESKLPSSRHLAILLPWCVRWKALYSNSFSGMYGFFCKPSDLWECSLAKDDNYL